MAAEELAASNWKDAGGDRWRSLWDAEVEGLPSHTESRLWLVTGLLLPIWDRLPGENMRVRRLATDAGESLLGRVLTPEQAHAFRDAFGLAGGPVMSSAEMHEAILTRGASFDLANGWRLARRRLMGAARVEIEGPDDGDLARSSAWGAPPRSSRGAPVCSCPNTSTSGASSIAGRSRLRARRKPARSRPVSGAGACQTLLPPATRTSGKLRLCAAHRHEQSNPPYGRYCHDIYMDASRFARDDLVCLAGRLQFYIRPVCAGFCPAGPDGICRSTPHSHNGLVAQDDMQAWRIAV